MTTPNAEAIEAGARELCEFDRVTSAPESHEWPAFEQMHPEQQALYRGGARELLRAFMPHLRAQWLAEVDVMLRDDRLAEVVALATGQHHIAYDGTDAMANDQCVCRQWADGTDGPDWDDHVAEVALRAAAAYLADTLGPTATAEPTTSTWTGPGCCQAADWSDGHACTCVPLHSGTPGPDAPTVDGEPT